VRALQQPAPPPPPPPPRGAVAALAPLDRPLASGALTASTSMPSTSFPAHAEGGRFGAKDLRFTGGPFVAMADRPTCLFSTTKKKWAVSRAAAMVQALKELTVVCRCRHRKKAAGDGIAAGIPEATRFVAAGEGGSESHRIPLAMKAIPAQQMVLA